MQSLLAALGGPHRTEAVLHIGEPARVSRRLRGRSGTEAVLDDDVVSAVTLHLDAAGAERPARVADWLPGLAADAGPDAFAETLGTRAWFHGPLSRFLELDGGYLQVTYHPGETPRSPGDVAALTATLTRPGTALQPEDDTCPVCSAVLVRPPGSETAGMDLDRTLASLVESVAAGRLTEDVSRVPLADLPALRRSGLMELLESQVTCTRCRRVLCLTIPLEGAPRFEPVVLGEAMHRPMSPVPPVAQWGDADRIAADAAALHYVDHEPSAWFLLRRGEDLYLDCRYSLGVADDSALVRLDCEEARRCETGGHEAVGELARIIANSCPGREGSTYRERDLFRGEERAARRREVQAAIRNHTWAASTRRPVPPAS